MLKENIENIKDFKIKASDISVLYVEDDSAFREEMSLYLKKIFKYLRVATNGEEGLALYREAPSDIVISDILMPRMDGIEMIRQIKLINPYQETILASAHSESRYFQEAISLGVDSYILKPVNYEQILSVLRKLVYKIMQEKENENYRNNLELMVQKKINEYKVLEREKLQYFEQTLMSLIKLIEERDSYTAGHSQRVATYSKMIAEEMGYTHTDCDLLYQAGILHDIGKIATPDTILLKPGTLSPIEHELIKAHVQTGINVLTTIPMFNQMLKIIQSHHERYDGKGYPNGLQQDEIHELAKIMIVADAFDAMTTNRIYKPRKSLDEALQEIANLSGTQFDPKVSPYAIKAFKKIKLEETTQLPSSKLEEERFSYFYKDNLTGLYNQNYLDVVLSKNIYISVYKCIHIVSIHRFKNYNDTAGWSKGDHLLQEIASMIKQKFSLDLVFRIHANDFVILVKDHLEWEEETFAQSEILKKYGLSCSHMHLDISDTKMMTIDTLEERIRHERSAQYH